jgi:hypothetical protein
VQKYQNFDALQLKFLAIFFLCLCDKNIKPRSQSILTKASCYWFCWLSITAVSQHESRKHVASCNYYTTAILTFGLTRRISQHARQSPYVILSYLRIFLHTCNGCFVIKDSLKWDFSKENLLHFVLITHTLPLQFHFFPYLTNTVCQFPQRFCRVCWQLGEWAMLIV